MLLLVLRIVKHYNNTESILSINGEQNWLEETSLDIWITALVN